MQSARRNKRTCGASLFALKLLLGCATALAVDVASGQEASSSFRPTYDPMQPHPKVTAALEKIQAGVQSGPFRDDWDSLSQYEIPHWYKDAKFGIFVHWGAYSVPAFGSEWYPRQMYIEDERRGKDFFGHHIKTHGTQDKFGYKDFIPMFKAESFDPNEWAELFQNSGAKYVVPVAEHHDGFPMYECSFTDWDASKMGPKRDLMAELSKSIRDRGMKLGLSSHRAFNWKFYVRRPNFDSADKKFAGLYGRLEDGCDSNAILANRYRDQQQFLGVYQGSKI